jgi:hypothetical protein
MHSPSLPPTTRRRKAPKLDKRVNLSFDTWFRQRTELPRQITGWTPLSVLYSDYLRFCGDTGVRNADIIVETSFRRELGTRCDRQPRKLQVTVGDARSYEECWPRFLIKPIRLGAFN